MPNEPTTHEPTTHWTLGKRDGKVTVVATSCGHIKDGWCLKCVEAMSERQRETNLLWQQMVTRFLDFYQAWREAKSNAEVATLARKYCKGEELTNEIG